MDKHSETHSEESDIVTNTVRNGHSDTHTKESDTVTNTVRNET